VLILDHGHGWTTVLTGLSAITVEQGANLIGGQAIGRAGERLRIQLLHHGRVADLPAMLAHLD
jgi:septal ring factor EnvC (AmiA/AmiB activator)